MLLHDCAEASRALAATRSRTTKAALVADALRRCEPAEVPVVAAWLSGELRQRRTGIGWRSVAALPSPAATPTLRVLEVDAALESLASLAGPGTQAARASALAALMARATASEQRYLASLLTGEVRQGALDGVILDAIALASGASPAAVRRAAMLAGGTPAVALAALTGGPDALSAFSLAVGTPVRPMLASSQPDVVAAFSRLGEEGPVAVEAKLDGIRIQVHREADDVAVFTRSLDDITARVPEVVEVVRALPVRSAVLDGEALLWGADGRPRPFQETSSRAASRAGERLSPVFFDALHLAGDTLIDRPYRERLTRLEGLLPGGLLVDRLVTDEPGDADAFAQRVLAAGHEGVVVKSLDSPYEAGRRGSAWVKVKPVRTLDLVVLAVEWGSGRRAGTLSNIHLGARDPAGGFIMLGKTFKGMTDAMLAWQTRRFLALETHREGHVVHVRPDQVVEIAFDGVQRSSRYPGGLALRFARVVRYRDDKNADQADTIDAVLALAVDSAPLSPGRRPDRIPR